MIVHRPHARAPLAPGESVPGARKEELRRAARRIRDAIPPERRAEAAESAAGHLLALPGLAAARRVALFAAVGSELDAGPAAGRLRARGVEIAYPRVGRASGLLEFCLVADDRELAPGAFGIPEPAAGAAAAPVGSIDAFVVPGLAFDAGGARVGWGRGYYDRALAAAPDRLRIGYCFACQVVDEVPLEPSDLPVHVLVTESGVLVPA
jgi:5-formyltetrahydrofolate cyclo-ligase